MPVINPPRIEILDEGVSQGRVTRVDYTGAGVGATVAGELATVNIPGGSGGDISMNKLNPAGDITIIAGYAAYISDYYEITLNQFLEIGLGSVFEIG